MGNTTAGFLDLFNRPTALLSIAALGVTPWVVGSGLVEIVAAIVPRWRPYRHDERRAKLARASIVVAVIAAFAQSLTLIRLLRISSYGGASLDDTPYAALYVGLTLVACACMAPVVVALARKHAVGKPRGA